MKQFLHITLLALMLGIGKQGCAQLLKKWGFYHSTTEVKLYKRAKLGFGIPYGMLGGNIEVGADYLMANFGLGYIFLKDVKGPIAYSAGLRGYVFRHEKPVRPRVGVQYGINYAYNENGKENTAKGFSVSAGFEHHITEKIMYDMDFCIILNATNSFRPDSRELENTMFPSIGVGVIF